MSSFGVGGTNAHARARRGARANHDHRRTAVGAPHDLGQERSRARRHDRTTRRTTSTGTRNTTLPTSAFTLARRAPSVPAIDVRVALDRNDRDAAVALLARSRTSSRRPKSSSRRRSSSCSRGRARSTRAWRARLYAAEAVVRDTIDDVLRASWPDLGLDLRDVLFPSDDATRRRRTPSFATPRSRNRRCSSWSTRSPSSGGRGASEPTAMIGHSVGEFVAATLAGVMALEDALAAPRRARSTHLVAACRVACCRSWRRRDDIADLPRRSDRAGRGRTRPVSACCRDLHACDRRRSASSSSSRDPRVAPSAHVTRVPLVDDGSDPRSRSRRSLRRSSSRSRELPYVATQTGAWAGVEATRPEYWSCATAVDGALRGRACACSLEHRDPVRHRELVLVEVGPGRTLTTFADQMSRTIDRTWHTVRRCRPPTSDEARSRRACSARWAACGSSASTSTGTTSTRRSGVDGSACRPIHSNVRATGSARPCEPPTPRREGPRDVSDWFYVPEWQPARRRHRAASPARQTRRCS